jgi:hypothetical protein
VHESPAEDDKCHTVIKSVRYDKVDPVCEYKLDNVCHTERDMVTKTQ